MAEFGQAHRPPREYVENEGYVGSRNAMPGSAHDSLGNPLEAQEDDAENDEDYDDLFEPSDDEGLAAGNPADYTKAYNRQRKLNDNSIPEAQKPKANPQLNTRAEIDDQVKALSKHTAKLKLGQIEGGVTKHHAGAEKSDRATSEQVLDPRTRMILLQMLNRNIISELNGVLSTGKEANVYHAASTPQEETGTDAPAVTLNRAVKVYKTSILVFKDRDKYVTGEFRFRQGYNKSSNRAMVKVWAEKEFRNLRRIYQAGIPCPEPVYLKAHVLVMGFIGSSKGVPAPRLRDVEFAAEEAESRWRDVYVELLCYMRKLYQICRLVHADLSEYNLLYHKSKLYVIDVSQSVEHDHPRSLEFLRMDIKNASDFFRRKGVDILSERTVFKYILASGGSTEESGMRADLDKLFEKKAQGDEEEGDEVDDEVFRQQYIPQTLQQVYDIERDGEQIQSGSGGNLVYEQLLANGEQKDQKANGEDADSESSEDDEDSDDDEEDDAFKEKAPRGKRFEDKDVKKAHKQAVKEEKRERRKEKMPKHLKKKLISGSSRGKK
ncbi:Serine/threonine-protein kinase RIO1 [Fulvia fulva]|uniref:Serine/threonine-protein kinase RIO1 n=1 Tax=Passalora fulva TaxID=5499 RepID=A0A9Q8LGY0_PASFU|nr:Serine/threonine-protein kinase RIO1 [Fulvia fulva]KAK4624691.1 Serine/threonine-protein kinase RIO1 [Fulvia fulva]KAK4625349.1 Serine/threonine-protein kinase RIO1 [Fulvia fulva]UJO17239.1 Serine/threonine-protein kinase RIO1 [Fulvia fulva]WPV14468.1 Serine/threonine-protein kinase RIO1 [Fulvia fulva]WPV29995.1 Serine/threonine-protein kinase RIO1 [Fulvia fulva]